MAEGKLPGMSYEDMYELIGQFRQPTTAMFSVELLLAIFWEESLFNNIKQEKGSAWGFGQVEPAEFYKVECPVGPPDPKDPRTMKPRELGYEVKGLPPRRKAGETTVLLGSLTPQQSVQVTAGLLRHYLEATKGKLQALYAYGGVGYKGTDVPAHLKKPSARQKIIAGWLECEKHLQGTPAVGEDYPTFVKKGLHLARPFEQNNKQIDDKLFPKDHTGKWRPRTPAWLINYMKTIK